jgi:hypothetical protein
LAAQILLTVTLVVFVVLIVIVGASYWIDKSTGTRD